jgi:hypothetical protein
LGATGTRAQKQHALADPHRQQRPGCHSYAAQSPLVPRCLPSRPPPPPLFPGALTPHCGRPASAQPPGPRGPRSASSHREVRVHVLVGPHVDERDGELPAATRGDRGVASAGSWGGGEGRAAAPEPCIWGRAGQGITQLPGKGCVRRVGHSPVVCYYCAFDTCLSCPHCFLPPQHPCTLSSVFLAPPSLGSARSLQAHPGARCGTALPPLSHAAGEGGHSLSAAPDRQQDTARVAPALRVRAVRRRNEQAPPLQSVPAVLQVGASGRGTGMARGMEII